MDKRMATIVVMGLSIIGLVGCRQTEVQERTPSKVSERSIPIVTITTEGGVMPSYRHVDPPEGCVGEGVTDNEYVPGQMVIGEGETLGMQLRIRGNTSAKLPCPHYKIKLDQACTLPGFDSQSANWVLLHCTSHWNHPNSLFNEHIGRAVATLCGLQGQPDFRYVELYINGSYRGLYLLGENISRGTHRVDVGEEGVIIEADPYWWVDSTECYFHTTLHPLTIGYTFKSPSCSKLPSGRIDEVQQRMEAFEQALIHHEDLSRHAELKSLAGWVLAHDILGTSDAMGSNIFYVIRKATSPNPLRIEMGPLWDYDTDYLCRDRWSTVHHYHSAYYDRLFEDRAFVSEYVRLWECVRDRIVPQVEVVIDSLTRTAQLQEAVERANSLSCCNNRMPSVEENLTFIREWYSQRIAWIEVNMDEYRIILAKK